MNIIMEKIRREPAVLVGLVSAVIALALAFGFTLTDEQVGAIMAVVVAVLSIVTRQAVTPNVSVAARKDPKVPEDAYVLRLSERGAVEAGWLLSLACVIVILCGLVWLIRAL